MYSFSHLRCPAWDHLIEGSGVRHFGAGWLDGGEGTGNVETLEGFPYLLEKGNRTLWGAETANLLSRRWKREVREDF